MLVDLPNDVQDYISAILGMKQPYRLVASDNGNKSPLLIHSLLEADSLWNLGESKASQEIIQSCKSKLNEESSSDDDIIVVRSFANGLESLNDGALTEALNQFQKAADASTSQPLLMAFFTERAVNIAFWMACSGSMLEAAKVLEDFIETTPFAGGVLSFAYHMSGDSVLAESIARKAIGSGMDDPWTIHAVAHALTSQDRHEECADWLKLHRSKVDQCNAFMKGHMEFHLALSYIYLRDATKLKDLIHGSLWGDISEEMKSDYWNASGLLNVLWKAEIRGLISNPAMEEYADYISQALDRIETVFDGVANVSKSSVFSLCIFRFTSGTMREKWNKALFGDDGMSNQVLVSVAKAISILYHGSAEQVVLDPLLLSGTKLVVGPVAGKLSQLGASPEQRETIDDFVQMIQDA